jgi:lipid A ethanolaminephosphotransferase
MACQPLRNPDSDASNPRWSMPAWLFGGLGAAYMLVFLNSSFWNELYQAFAASGGVRAQPGFALSVVVRVLCLQAVIVALVLWPRVGKPVLALLILMAAASAYTMDTFGTTFNTDVVASIFKTNRNELGAQVTPLALRWFALAGLLPAIILLCIPVHFAPWRRGLIMRVTLLATLAGLMASIAHLGGRSYRYWYRHHRDMYHVYNPYAALSGTLRYLKRDVFAPPSRRALIPVARDAVLGPANQAGRKRLLVLVVGETARAQNFSLGGYARDTNPQMRRRGAYYFADTWACGTTTAVSVPCMFSGLTQSGFDKADPVEHWNLLDVVQHAGVDVLWRDNDGGCQGVCARVPNEDLTHATLGKLCDDHGCRDDVLVDDLPKQLAKLGPPALLILHGQGSHGPDYFRRYPESWRQFAPGCDTAEVHICTYQQVLNTYDNTILYTDYLLGRVVDGLQTLPDGIDTAMLYVSDHGESLGENDIYLHGADAGVALEQQWHVPMLLWLSPGWTRTGLLDEACVAARQQRRHSHDNLYDTVLGLLDVRTSIYRPSLDLLSECRQRT